MSDKKISIKLSGAALDKLNKVKTSFANKQFEKVSISQKNDMLKKLESIKSATVSEEDVNINHAHKLSSIIKTSFDAKKAADDEAKRAANEALAKKAAEDLQKQEEAKKKRDAAIISANTPHKIIDMNRPKMRDNPKPTDVNISTKDKTNEPEKRSNADNYVNKHKTFTDVKVNESGFKHKKHKNKSHDDFDDESTDLKQAKTPTKDKQSKIVEKYGIERAAVLSAIEMMDDSDLDVLKELADTHPEITQEQLDNDEEKVLGKDLVIKRDSLLMPTILGVPKKREKKKGVKKDYDKIYRDVELSGNISVADLAEKMSEKVGDVIKVLMKHGFNANINQVLDIDTAHIIAEEMGHDVVIIEAENILDVINNEFKKVNPTEIRVPVVTIMGHVDHGKTSLLDVIRNSNVTSKESGGITQHIGAYTIKTKSGHDISFIDTPGHAAFSAMRARGAKLTDIAILVVAADDGIQPQTIEAIKHIKDAKVPMIVAINKIDKGDANVNNVKQALLQHDVLTTDFGGEVVAIGVSALKGTNIDQLLDEIHLQAEVMEIKSDPKARAFGVVVESKFDKYKGNIATIILQHGSLKVGDNIVAGKAFAKIRLMYNDRGDKVNILKPGIPVEVTGFENSAIAGDFVCFVNNDKEARELISIRSKTVESDFRLNVDISNALLAKKKQVVNIILKADTSGSLEAIKGMVSTINHEEIEVKIISSGIGNIVESDGVLAKDTDSLIIGFNVSVDARMKSGVERGQVKVKLYNIIYNLIDELKDYLSSKLGVVRSETLVGTAEVKQLFKSGKNEVVAGSVVLSGQIIRNNFAKVLRAGTVVFSAKIKTIKRFTEDVKEARKDQECGILLEQSYDFMAGDIIECYEESFTSQKII